MHEFRRFIEQQMEHAQMDQAKLAKASGLSPQHISQLLKDDRPVMARMPAAKTISGLARAFRGVTEEMVRAKAVQGLGVPPADAPPMVLDLHQVSVDMLLGEVRRRIERGGDSRDASLEERQARAFDALITAGFTPEQAAQVLQERTTGDHGTERDDMRTPRKGRAKNAS